MRFLLIILSLIVISCTKYSILSNETKHINGSDFYKALAAGYNQLAQKEKDEFDWQDADLFGEKGLKALNNQDVQPEHPNNREFIEEMSLSELLIARTKMLEIFNLEVKGIKNIKFEFPLKSARLQVLYEYWLEQAEENLESKEIFRYREEFWNSYRNLESAIKLAKAKIKKQNKFNNQFHTIYFDHNENNLDNIAQEKLNRIIYYLQKLPKYKIILEGHTDLSGDKKYNYQLAQERLNSVKDYLIKNKILASSFVKEDIYGKDKPHITKPSGGYKERLNRRVEIYIINK